MSELNVLHLTASLHVGGAERLIFELVRHLDPDEVRPHVYAFGSFAGESMLAEFRSLGVPLRKYPSGRFYNPMLWADLARYVRKNDIDLIHTHLCDGDIMGRSIGRMAGVPVISTLQNAPRDFDHYRMDRRVLSRWTASRFGPQLVAVSKLVRDQFMSEWGTPGERIASIYNAVDLQPYLAVPTAATDAPRKRPFVVTNVARHTEQKAQHVLLQAFARLLDVEKNCELWMVGDGERREELEKLAASMGIADRVIFQGVRRDIPNVLEQSDVFVLSSDWEGLPLSAVEAMAAARPVVLTDVGGNSELMQTGDEGTLVAPRDPVALADALVELLQQPDQRLRMGEAGRSTALKSFDIASVARQYETLYRRILGRATLVDSNDDGLKDGVNGSAVPIGHV